MMKKESQASLGMGRKKINYRSEKKQVQTDHTNLDLSRNSFVQELKKLPLEERYLAVKIYSPGLAKAIRNNIRKNQYEWSNEGFQGNSENKKSILRYNKTLLDILVFISDGRDFYDNIGFDFTYIENPQKLYDLLMMSNENKQQSNCIENFKNATKCCKQIVVQLEQTKTKQNLNFLVTHFLRYEIFHKSFKQIKHHLQQQKSRKKQFVNYWKKIFPLDRKKILFLGLSDIKQLINYLVDRGIYLHPQILQTQIQQLLAADNNQFCNRIFKSKIKKSINIITDYYEMIYQEWKLVIEEKNRYIKIKKNISQHERTSHKIYSKKKKTRCKNKSSSVESNETTQTENNQIINSIDVKNIIMDKLNQDLMAYSDLLSEESNLLQDRRIVVFQRLQFILSMYQIPIKLFGSCANGIAIANSDVDIAIDNCILSYFTHVIESQRVKIALQWLEQLFKVHQWVVKIKLITTASIPLIKMKVNTNYPMIGPNSNFLNLQKIAQLNRHHNCGQLQIDISIQTKDKDYCCNHLGIISTIAIQKWLKQIETLQPIVVVLKNYFNKRKLNITYEGGINAYSMIIMIVAFVYHHSKEQQTVVASVFKQFLQFYTKEFDQFKFQIDIQNKKQIFIAKSIVETQKKNVQLSIKDPMNNGKVMTKNCHQFTKIKKLFQQIYDHCFQSTQKNMQKLISSINPKMKNNIIDLEINELKKQLYNKFQSLLD